MTSNGVRSTGGSAATATSPNRKARPYRRHPDKAASSNAKRQSGICADERGWTRETEASDTSAAPLTVLAIAHPQPLDPARIGIEYFELDPRRMPDHLAAARHAAGQAGNQP